MICSLFVGFDTIMAESGGLARFSRCSPKGGGFKQKCCRCAPVLFCYKASLAPQRRTCFITKNATLLGSIFVWRRVGDSNPRTL